MWNAVLHFRPNPIEPNIAQNAPVRFTADRKQQVTGNGGRETTNRVPSCGYIPHLQTGNYEGEYTVSLTPQNQVLIVRKEVNAPCQQNPFTFARNHRPRALSSCPAFCSRLQVFALSNEAKILYAMILRRTELSRKSGWADDYGKIYLYYPINEVCGLLHCGRQKAVDTLRELQYADLVSIKKQGCGKPNRIYPKRYEVVSHTDFKESG